MSKKTDRSIFPKVKCDRTNLTLIVVELCINKEIDYTDVDLERCFYEKLALVLDLIAVLYSQQLKKNMYERQWLQYSQTKGNFSLFNI